MYIYIILVHACAMPGKRLKWFICEINNNTEFISFTLLLVSILESQSEACWYNTNFGVKNSLYSFIIATTKKNYIRLLEYAQFQDGEDT